MNGIVYPKETKTVRSVSGAQNESIHVSVSSSQERALTTALAPVLHVSGLLAAMLREPAPVARSQAQRARNKIVYSFRHR
jgi:hypothetical protein